MPSVVNSEYRIWFLITCFWIGSLGGDCNGLDLGFNTPEKAASPPATPDSSGTSPSGIGTGVESLICS